MIEFFYPLNIFAKGSIPDFYYALNTLLRLLLLPTEAGTRGVLLKKVFSKISQNSQENTFARFSFLKWLVGLKLIKLEQQKTQLPFVILAKNLKPTLCRVVKCKQKSLNWK